MWRRSLWVAFVVGCSGASDPSPLDVEDALAGLDRETCFVAVCGFHIDPLRCDDFPGLDAEATSEGFGVSPRRAGDYRRALEAGTLRIDDAAARRCFDEVEATIASCWGVDADERRVQALAADLRLRRGVCAGVLVGNVAPGGGCVLHEECTSGVCDAAPDRCPGVCVVGPGDGERCEERCAIEFDCVAATCTPAGAEGTRCRRDGDCAAGLSCGLDGECRVCPGGEPLRCARACDGTCHVGEQDSRFPDVECQGRQLCAGLFPEIGVCHEPETLGRPCSGPCLEPWVCDDARHRCVEPPAVGQPCSGACVPEAYCDGVRCVARKADGETCARGAECLGAVCDDARRCAHPEELAACHFR